MWGSQTIAKLVQLILITVVYDTCNLYLQVLISIITGVLKPTNITGKPHLAHVFGRHHIDFTRPSCIQGGGRKTEGRGRTLRVEQDFARSETSCRHQEPVMGARN